MVPNLLSLSGYKTLQQRDIFELVQPSGTKEDRAEQEKITLDDNGEIAYPVPEIDEPEDDRY